MEFFPKVVTINGVSPVSYIPQVVMADGAVQWSGFHHYDKEVAQCIANQAAKAYNEY